jgi:hypothetical protein
MTAMRCPVSIAVELATARTMASRLGVWRVRWLDMLSLRFQG